jgi:hypothetical protein
MENFIFDRIQLKHAKKTRKPGRHKALFTAVTFALKYTTEPEVVQIYAFRLA